MRRRRAALAVAGVFVCALAPGAQAQPAPGGAPPPGANDWSCKPSAAHPNPVVLTHGLSANMGSNWGVISPRLAQAGYCVFALTYGIDPRVPDPLDQLGGVVPMEQSAEELAAFVDRVLAATGAREVDIVGHSEGSLMPNYYVKFLGGAAKVEHYVGLTPVWRGTAIALAAAPFADFCGSCPQFAPGSPFLEKMNEGGAAAPGVVYTNIVTRYDELVVPYSSGFMHVPNATNIVLQDQCATDFAEHVAVAFDPVAIQDILNALDPAHPAPVRCRVVLPVIGGLGQ